jgi:general secretion pathway protein J
MMRRAGFTLIEVVIAIFIAAIMFAIGYRTLSQALNDREALNTSQTRVNEIQRGMRIVAQDFAQIVARGARDTQSNGELQPALLANNRDNVLLTFSRTGWSNPAGLQRPAEERVRYRFVDGSLVREHWVSMDPVLNTEPRQRVILTRVKSIEVRFLDPVTRNWRTDWPPVTPNGPVGPMQVDEVLLLRPLAIEVSLVLEDWGRVHRLFEIPT